MIQNKKRTLVFGDIHGQYNALIEVLEKAKVIPNDKLIFLGDYVDRGPDSAKVVQKLIELSETNECIFLKGNHDEWCKDWLVRGIRNKEWFSKETIESYIDTKFIIDPKHEQFFVKLKPFYIDYANRGFVHGGFNSKLGLGNEVYESNYWWDRDMWSLAQHAEVMKNTDATPHELRFLKHSEIYIGHNPTTSQICKPHYKESKNSNQIIGNPITIPMHRMNVWNVDTGAGSDYKGKLTALDINSKEFFQSDFIKQ